MARLLVAGERETANTFGRHLDADHEILLSYRSEEALEIAQNVDCVVALDPVSRELAEASFAAPTVAVTNENVVADAVLPPNVDSKTLRGSVEDALGKRQ